MHLVDEELYNYIYKIQPIEFFSSKKKGSNYNLIFF
jgi:hypothetical protein